MNVTCKQSQVKLIEISDEDGVLSFAELNIVMKSLGQRPSGEYSTVQLHNTYICTPVQFWSIVLLDAYIHTHLQYT